MLDTLSGTGHSEFVVDVIRDAIAEEPRVGGKLALWGRRFMGEALSQAQTVVAERDALTAVLVGNADRPGAVMDLTVIGRMLTRLTEAHTERMDKLGLAACPDLEVPPVDELDFSVVECDRGTRERIETAFRG